MPDTPATPPAPQRPALSAASQEAVAEVERKLGAGYSMSQATLHVVARLAALEAEIAAAPKLWECPDCAFTFDAAHEDDTPQGGYSCPVCAVAALEAQAAQRLHDFVDQVNALNGELARWKGLAECRPEYEELQRLIAVIRREGDTPLSHRCETEILGQVSAHVAFGHAVAERERRLERENAELRGLVMTGMDLAVEGAADCQSYDFKPRASSFASKVGEFFAPPAGGTT